jgi:hypothetical protein
MTLALSCALRISPIAKTNANLVANANSIPNANAYTNTNSFDNTDAWRC